MPSMFATVDGSYAAYYAKLADALSRVSTPFVVMADNDDFFIPQGLARAVKFCSRTPTMLRARTCAMFWLGNPGGRTPAPTATVSSGSGSQFRPTSPHQTSGCLGECSAPMTCFALSTVLTCYEVISKRCATAITRPVPVEQLVMFLPPCGKTRQLETLSIAPTGLAAGSGSAPGEFGDWCDRILLPTWSDDFTRFVDCWPQRWRARRHVSGRGPADRRAVLQTVGRPSLLADLVEEPTVSWSMPMVLQVVALPGACRARTCSGAPRRRGLSGARAGCHMTSCTAPRFRTRRAREAAREFTPVARSWPTRPITTRGRRARKRSSGRR